MTRCFTQHENPAPFQPGSELSAAGRDWEEVSGSYSVAPVTFAALRDRWSSSDGNLDWNCLFTLPVWLESWWDAFGGGREPLLWEIHRGERLLGIAPLQVEGETAWFMGSADVCDYQDFVVVPGEEKELFGVLLHFLHRQGIQRLDLHGVRPDSATMRALPEAAAARGFECLLHEEDVSFELALPATWEGYLAELSGKERHEIHRKLRRLEENSRYRLQVLEGPREVNDAMGEFLDLFRLSRPEKEAFLTESREHFLRRLVRSMADHHLVKLCFLEIGGIRAAAALCFDYRGSMYLYNSGLNPDFRQLSAGLICKILTLRHSILSGRKGYDFLKGSEIYKHRLGAKPIPLFRCRVKLN